MRLKHHTAVSYLALFVALGGTGAYAATSLAPNSVGTRQIRDRSVRVRDLAPAARPTSKAKIADAVTQVLSDPTTGLNITVHGEKGDAGVAGPQGPQGPQGTSGIAAIHVRDATAPAPSSSDASVAARCQPGEVIIGGGGRLEGAAGYITASLPVADTDQAWDLSVTNASGTDGTVHAWALCALLG